MHLTGAYETQIAALKAETELLQQVRTQSFTRTLHHRYLLITLFCVILFILPSFIGSFFVIWHFLTVSSIMFFLTSVLFSGWLKQPMLSEL